MPITTPPPYAVDLDDTDHFDHVLKHLFMPALERAGYNVIPPKARGSTLIHAEIIRHLEEADLVLADLSSQNSNVFFELGVRTALDRPVALVTDHLTSAIPFDLGSINVHTYDESLKTWTLEKEIEGLAEHVSHTDPTSGNAMWKYFGLTQRAGPAEAGGIEAKIDLILEKVGQSRRGEYRYWIRTPASQAWLAVNHFEAGANGFVAVLDDVNQTEISAHNIEMVTYRAGTL
jgi:hypothetical protein